MKDILTVFVVGALFGMLAIGGAQLHETAGLHEVTVSEMDQVPRPQRLEAAVIANKLGDSVKFYTKGRNGPIFRIHYIQVDFEEMELSRLATFEDLKEVVFQSCEISDDQVRDLVSAHTEVRFTKIGVKSK